MTSKFAKRFGGSKILGAWAVPTGYCIVVQNPNAIGCLIEHVRLEDCPGDMIHMHGVANTLRSTLDRDMMLDIIGGRRGTS